MAYPIILKSTSRNDMVLDVDRALKPYPDYLSDEDIGRAMASYTLDPADACNAVVLVANEIHPKEPKGHMVLSWGDTMVFYKVVREQQHTS